MSIGEDFRNIIKDILEANKNPKDFLLIVACLFAYLIAVQFKCIVPLVLLIVYIIFNHFLCKMLHFDKYAGLLFWGVILSKVAPYLPEKLNTIFCSKIENQFFIETIKIEIEEKQQERVSSNE